MLIKYKQPKYSLQELSRDIPDYTKSRRKMCVLWKELNMYSINGRTVAYGKKLLMPINRIVSTLSSLSLWIRLLGLFQP
jgi:hypothetical protein